MAGSSVIGALRVDLGLNSAQFNAGLAKAQTGLKGFGKAAAIGFNAIKIAAVAATGALALAVKGSIDHADALNKSAQKAGVAVEALSRLEYAAKFSDISLEQLTGGLQKLNKSMVEVAAGKGPVAAFKALGVAITDSTGNLRSGDAVFADLADRFSRIEDGALKTKIAMDLFGKSGAELIPLLNEGAGGLAEFARQSDATGNTISTKTAKAAEEFNDQLTQIGTVLQGVVTRIMEAVLPSLKDFASWLQTLNPEVIRMGIAFAGVVAVVVPLASGINAVAGAASLAIPLVTGLTTAIIGAEAAAWGWLRALTAVGAALAVIWPTAAGGQSELDWEQANRDMWAGRKSALEELKGKLAAGNAGNGTDVASIYQGIFAGAGGATPQIDLSSYFDDVAKALEPLDLGLQDVEDSVTSLAETISSTLADSLTNIAETLLTGGDAAAAFANEMKNLGLQLLRSGLNSLFTNALDGLNPFGGSKGYTPGFGSYGMFAEGGISNVPAIFGESGPEAAVPLPDGRRIPVELRGNTGGDSLVRIELGPELVGRVLKQAANQSVQIVKSQASAAVASDQRNKRF